MWGQADGEDGSRHHPFFVSKNNQDLNGQSNKEKEREREREKYTSKSTI